MNQVLIQLIYFVIYSVVFLVIGKLSFSESDSLSKFFVGSAVFLIHHKKRRILIYPQRL